MDLRKTKGHPMWWKSRQFICLSHLRRSIAPADHLLIHPARIVRLPIHGKALG